MCRWLVAKRRPYIKTPPSFLAKHLMRKRWWSRWHRHRLMTTKLSSTLPDVDQSKFKTCSSVQHNSLITIWNILGFGGHAFYCLIKTMTSWRETLNWSEVCPWLTGANVRLKLYIWQITEIHMTMVTLTWLRYLGS